MTDARTIATYDARAADYAARFDGPPSGTLAAFIADMPPGARVLDLGCGPGTASRHMADAGLRPDPVDASPEMVRLATARGLPARHATFDDIDGEAACDGVWANFSLLHAPRDALPRHLAALARALKPGGQLHIGMKTGTGTSRDTLGRLYTYVTLDELHALLQDAGLTVTDTRTGSEPGLAGTDDAFAICRASKES